MPGTRCTVAVCNNSYEKTKRVGLAVIYHQFPKSKSLRDIWIQRCLRDGNWNPNACHVCSVHFTEEDYEKDTQILNCPLKKRLKATAVPSLFLNESPPIVELLFTPRKRKRTFVCSESTDVSTDENNENINYVSFKKPNFQTNIYDSNEKVKTLYSKSQKDSETRKYVQDLLLTNVESKYLKDDTAERFQDETRKCITKQSFFVGVADNCAQNNITESFQDNRTEKCIKEELFYINVDNCIQNNIAESLQDNADTKCNTDDTLDLIDEYIKNDTTENIKKSKLELKNIRDACTQTDKSNFELINYDLLAEKNERLEREILTWKNRCKKLMSNVQFLQIQVEKLKTAAVYKS